MSQKWLIELLVTPCHQSFQIEWDDLYQARPNKNVIFTMLTSCLAMTSKTYARVKLPLFLWYDAVDHNVASSSVEVGIRAVQRKQIAVWHAGLSKSRGQHCGSDRSGEVTQRKKRQSTASFYLSFLFTLTGSYSRHKRVAVWYSIQVHRLDLNPDPVARYFIFQIVLLTF